MRTFAVISPTSIRQRRKICIPNKLFEIYGSRFEDFPAFVSGNIDADKFPAAFGMIHYDLILRRLTIRLKGGINSEPQIADYSPALFYLAVFKVL
jgi:hypothetical protein